MKKQTGKLEKKDIIKLIIFMPIFVFIVSLFGFQAHYLFIQIGDVSSGLCEWELCEGKVLGKETDFSPPLLIFTKKENTLTYFNCFCEEGNKTISDDTINKLNNYFGGNGKINSFFRILIFLVLSIPFILIISKYLARREDEKTNNHK